METLKYIWAQAKASWTMICAKVMLAVAAIGEIADKIADAINNNEIKQQVTEAFNTIGVTPKTLAIISVVFMIARIRGLLKA